MNMMNQEAMMAVEKELQLAGTDPKLRKRWETLEERRITPEKEIPPMEFLFELFNKPCFPRGELVAMTGKAKSGKTFMSTILMVAGFTQKCMGLKRQTEPMEQRVQNHVSHELCRVATEEDESQNAADQTTPSFGHPSRSSSARLLPEGRKNLGGETLHVLWFDTEQSEESTQDILRNRLIAMAKDIPEGMLDIFNVRGEFWQERLPLLEAAIGRFQPDLVILDGIRDLTDDINDGVKAQQVIERLMHMASTRHCCIVCILHQNKAQEDRSMRGWMGTELKNKAFETYECSKRDGVFSVKQADTRKYVITDKLEFTVDENGLPKSLTQQKTEESSCTASKPSKDSMVRPKFTEKYILEHQPKYILFNLPLLFGDALPNGVKHDEQTLKQKVMDLASMTSPNLFYSLLNKAVKEGVVSLSLDGFNRKLYCLA